MVWPRRAQELGATRRTRRSAAGLSSLTDFQVTRWFGDKFRADHPQVVEDCVDTFVRNDVAAYAQTCRMLGACDLRAGLASIGVPTAIVVGEEDYATPPAMAQAMHEAIAGIDPRRAPRRAPPHPVGAPRQIAAELERLAQRTS